MEIDPDANVFMSDAEGPRMASQGDFVVLTYQISGEWANGARSVHSMDGGLTWSAPVAMVSGADADHFMPCVAIDNNGNPFAGVKVGNNSASIFEGILRSEDGGNSWLPAVNASANAAGEAVCECCPSQPFWTAGRYYDLVRNNNENIRDFWLMSSADGENWDAALDIDPLDWEINSCPESGATLAGPVVGTEYLTAFMSAGGPSGQSRVYVSSIDLEANGGAGEWLSTEPITVSQFDNATQNTPVLGQWQGADGTSIVALAWEQNAGGYDVQLALSAGRNGRSPMLRKTSPRNGRANTANPPWLFQRTPMVNHCCTWPGSTVLPELFTTSKAEFNRPLGPFAWSVQNQKSCRTSAASPSKSAAIGTAACMAFGPQMVACCNPAP